MTVCMIVCKYISLRDEDNNDDDDDDDTYDINEICFS